jgi:hypothetical protein
MFYLRINKVKILNNREMLGKGEIQFMSFVTKGESGFPMLQEFFQTNNTKIKKELITQAIEEVVSSRILMPIQKFKDNQQVYFGDTGYIVFKSKTIPEDLNWMFLAIELDHKTRTNATLLSDILTDKNLTAVVDSISSLASITNPVASAVTKLTTFTAKALTEVFKNNRDDQAGLFLASFIEKEHYPFGKRDKEDVPDLTANMFLDYTLFAYE